MISSFSGSEPRPVPGHDVARAVVGDRAADVAAPVAVGAGGDGEPDHVDTDRLAAAHGHRHHARAEGTAEERHGHPGSAGGYQPELGDAADGIALDGGHERAEATAPPSWDFGGLPAVLIR